MLARALNGWQVSGTVFWHSGMPFSVLSAPYSANGNGIVQGSGPQFASVVPGVPLYEHNPIPGVTQPGTIQWLNPDAFVSAVDPSTGACAGGDSPKNCQFGNLGRNALRGPDFTWSDLYLTKWFPLTERVKLRIDGQFFNVFNHPNFGLPVLGYAGIPGKPSTQTGFGALSYTTVAADRTARRRLGRRQLASHDRVPGATGVPWAPSPLLSARHRKWRRAFRCVRVDLRTARVDSPVRRRGAFVEATPFRAVPQKPRP